MDLGIAGRRAAVAAGSAGLGYGTAMTLAAEGVDVAVCGRDADRLQEAVNRLGVVATGEWPIGVVADVSDTDGAEAFIANAGEALGGPVDILVCNAGGPPPGDPLATDLAAYRSAFELNCMSTIAMCQAAVPAMCDQGWGRVLAITSIGARQPIGFLAASSTARAAVTGFLKVLSSEVAADGVTVNSLQPGSHRTDRIASLSAERTSELTSRIPAGRMGEAADFGAVAAFLCSQQARFVTGVGLHVDGGAYRGLQ